VPSPTVQRSTSERRTNVRCTCSVNERRTKETIRSGLKVVRIRFHLAKGELPDLGPADLGKYLLHLLSPPGEKPFPLPFPRAQLGWDGPFPHLVRLGRYDRWLFAQSLSSIKRALPNLTCEKHPPPSGFPAWKANACQATPPEATPHFREFCRRQCRRFFPVGWDRNYTSFCESFIPSASAREEPLTTGSGWWASSSSRTEFQVAVRRGRMPSSVKGRFRLRYKEVPSTGKVRPLGIPSVEYDLLGPLHKAIYDRLSKTGWLLKGPPKSSRIKRVCCYKWQTSVDLVGATDGLRLDVTEALLGVILSRATSIPGRVKQLACESLYPTVRGSRVTFGQMMGTYLSFPLLCLTSYCAAKWAARGSKSSILINGDDCLISSTSRDVLNRYPVGFRINTQKTCVSQVVAEINSTTFLRKGKVWKEVQNLRRGGGEAYTVEGLRHLATACIKAGPKWMDAFSLSGICKRYHVRMEDLGMPSWIPNVYKQIRTQRWYRQLPPPCSVPLDDRLVQVSEETTYEEKVALYELLFNEGRKTNRQPSSRTFISSLSMKTARRYKYALSYRPKGLWEEERELLTPKRRKKWFIPADYEGRERKVEMQGVWHLAFGQTKERGRRLFERLTGAET